MKHLVAKSPMISEIKNKINDSVPVNFIGLTKSVGISQQPATIISIEINFIEKTLHKNNVMQLILNNL